MKYFTLFIIGAYASMMRTDCSEGGRLQAEGGWLRAEGGRRQMAALGASTMMAKGKPGSVPGGYEGMPTTATQPRPMRSTRYRKTFHPSRVNDCDFGGLMCLRAFKTGVLCARTAYYTYSTFKNMCEMDFVNCYIGHERWLVMHMGQCLEHAEVKMDYAGDNTYRSREDFLNNDYVVSEVGA